MTQLITMFRLLGTARRAVIGGVVMRLIQSLGLGIAFGAAMRLVVRLISGEPIGQDLVLRTAMACGVSLLIQLAAGWAAARLSWLASYQAVANMRLALLQHLQRIPVNALGRRSRGDIAALLSTDLQLIEDFLAEGMPRLGQALGIPLIVIVAVGVNDLTLATAIAVPILAMMPVMSWSSKKLATLADRRQSAQAHAAARMIDLVTAMPALRVYSTRERTAAWYSQAVEEFRAISVEMVHKLIVPSSLAGLILMLGIPLVAATGGWRLSGPGTSAALIGVVLVMVLNVYQPVQGLLSTNESWQMAQAALRRVQEISDIPPLPEPAQPAQPPTQFDVELCDVDYVYPSPANHTGDDATHTAKTLKNQGGDNTQGTIALRGVNLRARAGQMTAIVGPSGSGKSTVLSLISRFDDPTTGSIRIGGVNLKEIAAPDRSDLVTVVFQDVHLFPGTIADNIGAARPGASRSEIERAARIACADEFIAALPDGYDTILGEDGAGLSGGQRQRLSIARAALKDAPIVLLDEATSALDPVNEAAVQRGIRALCQGRTTIVVAHKLATIAAADQIVVLEAGQVTETGTHQELLSRAGAYARLWTTAARSEDWAL